MDVGGSFRGSLIGFAFLNVLWIVIGIFGWCLIMNEGLALVAAEEGNLIGRIEWYSEGLLLLLCCKMFIVWWGWLLMFWRVNGGLGGAKRWCSDLRFAKAFFFFLQESARSAYDHSVFSGIVFNEKECADKIFALKYLSEEIFVGLWFVDAFLEDF